MRKILGYVLVNLAVLIGGYLCIFFLVSAGQDVWRVTGKAWLDPGNPRIESPAYEDKDKARRIFADQKAGDSIYTPFVGWRQKPFASQTLNIDSEGNRVHALGKDNRAGSPSLGMFGGSTMWGTGVDDNDTIAAIFDQITDGFVVHNYGERGHTSRQNLAQLINLANTGRMPQIVVFYEGYNDVWTHCNYAVTESLNGHMEERKIRNVLEERKEDGHVYRNFIMPALRAIRSITGQNAGANRFGCASEPERAESVAEMMVATWEIAHQIVVARGGKFHLFLQPSAYVGNANTSYLDVGRLRSGRAEQFDAVYPLVRNKLMERGVTWSTDLSDAFDGERPLYIDDVHVVAAGNRIVAEAMRRRIAPE